MTSGEIDLYLWLDYKIYLVYLTFMVSSSSTFLLYVIMVKILRDFIKVMMNLSKGVYDFTYVSCKHTTLYVFIHSFMHSFNKYHFNIYQVPESKYHWEWHDPASKIKNLKVGEDISKSGNLKILWWMLRQRISTLSQQDTEDSYYWTHLDNNRCKSYTAILY